MSHSEANPHVLFVLPVVGQPRHSKRIGMAKAGGLEVSAAAFERDYHKGRLPDCELATLGSVEHGGYLRRIPRLLAAVRRLRKISRHADVLYAFGPDMAFVALAARGFRRQAVVMEIGDLIAAQANPGMLGRLFRAAERVLAGRCGLIVTTTDAFLRNYYREWLRCGTPGMVIENKVEAAFADSVTPPPPPAGRPLADRPLRIGLFGLLRCRWSWQVLSALAERHPGRFEIVLAGFPVDPPDVADQVKSRAGLTYLGQYKSPDDLERLYGQVDMVWACYHPLRPDEYAYWWARPNRFYESCLFRRPLFSRKGTCDAEQVDARRIGMTIEETDPVATADLVASVTAEDVGSWALNMSRLPRGDYAYTDEQDRLCAALRSLARGGLERDP